MWRVAWRVEGWEISEAPTNSFMGMRKTEKLSHVAPCAPGMLNISDVEHTT